jgi:hypothetical protein
VGRAQQGRQWRRGCEAGGGHVCGHGRRSRERNDRGVLSPGTFFLAWRLGDAKRLKIYCAEVAET